MTNIMDKKRIKAIAKAHGFTYEEAMALVKGELIVRRGTVSEAQRAAQSEASEYLAALRERNLTAGGEGKRKVTPYVVNKSGRIYNVGVKVRD